MGSAVVVMANGAAVEVTVMLSALVAVPPLLSATRTVKLLVPVAVGVPEITPVLDANPTPAGRLPALSDQL